MRKILLIAVVALWTTTSADAQTDSNMLRGFRQFHLLVDSLDKDEDANKCGLSHKDLNDAFVNATQYAAFRLSRDADALVYINPTILAVGDNQCIYSINVQVVALETVRLSQSRRTVDGFVELWSHSTLGQAPPRIFAQQARDATRTIAEGLLRDWNLDNR